MHILAPQVENLFRNIAKEVGGLTVTLKDDGSSMEKVSSSILSLPELLDCYDNDILFTFRGLLNEQASANIRNEIAHGIISEYACSDLPQSVISEHITITPEILVKQGVPGYFTGHNGAYFCNCSSYRLR